MTFLWLLEGIRTPFFDKLMQVITYFGQEIIIMAVICTLYWCADKHFAYLLGFTYFTAGLCVQSLKITFRIPRPWILDPDFHAVKSALPGATGYSFPSGHTQGATCLFFPAALKAKRLPVKVLCILAFMIIGFSRMYLGCHTPKDVLVSMALSIFFSCLIWHYQHFLLNGTKYRKYILTALAFLSIAAAAYSMILYKNGTIEAKYVMDCFKASGAGIGFAAGWYIERTKLNFDTHANNTIIQILKIVLGLLGALIIKESFSLIFGSSVLAKMAEYFILMLWVLLFYPYIFSKVLRR